MMKFFGNTQVKQIQHKWNVPLTHFPNKHLKFFRYEMCHFIDLFQISARNKKIYRNIAWQKDTSII